MARVNELDCTRCRGRAVAIFLLRRTLASRVLFYEVVMPMIQCVPQEFFNEALGEAMERRRVSVSPFVHAYLVRLLLWQIDSGHHPDEILAYLFLEAKRTGGYTGALKMSAVGDRALVFCGLWWERQYRLRRPFDAKYHIDLGRSAYRAVGGAVFEELSKKFEWLVDALNELCITRVMTNRELVRMFELYERTKSTQAARVLLAHGVSPMSSRSQTPS